MKFTWSVFQNILKKWIQKFRKLELSIDGWNMSGSFQSFAVKLRQKNISKISKKCILSALLNFDSINVKNCIFNHIPPPYRHASHDKDSNTKCSYVLRYYFTYELITECTTFDDCLPTTCCLLFQTWNTEMGSSTCLFKRCDIAQKRHLFFSK